MRAAPLVLSIVAVLMAGLALAKSPGSLLSTGSGMDAYDFSSPEAAWRSRMEIETDENVQAMIQLGNVLGRERRESAELIDTAPFGDRVILFIRHEEDGKPKHITQGMKLVQGTDVWGPDYISRYDIGGKDKKLGDRMKAWEAKNKD